jgi:multidrug resistance efflux pump
MHSTLQSWLDLVCQMLPRVSSAAVLQADVEDVSIVWPQATTVPDEMLSAASMTSEQQAPVIVDKGTQLLVAYPLTADSEDVGVVVLIIDANSEQQPIIMQLLDWSRSWLELLLRNRSDGPSAGDLNQDAALLLIHKLLELDGFDTATTSLVTFLADYLHCERVSLGLPENDGMSIAALSHTAHFDARINLAGMMQSAMEEAVREDETIAFASKENSQPNLVAHELLAKELQGRYLLTLLMKNKGEVVGALLLERATPFAQAEVNHIQTITGILSQIVATLMIQRLGLLKKAKRKLASWLSSSMGPGSVTTRLVILAILILAPVLAFVEGDYEVTANATLEGFTQQAIVAPYNGFISEAHSRAGDIVLLNQLLGRMDDRDLLLELQRISNEQEDLTRQYRQALASLNQSESRIFKARVDEAGARWALLKRRLDQVELRAPINGIIITGDLSRSLGAPVEKGDLLFEIAPLESYRIVLFVEENDIDEISVGLPGEVILTSHPTRQIPFVVNNIASVLQSEQGLGVVFKTEGALKGEYDFLRPGMEGIARVAIGRRSLGWILFHDAYDWIRLGIWRWQP